MFLTGQRPYFLKLYSHPSVCPEVMKVSGRLNRYVSPALSVTKSDAFDLRVSIMSCGTHAKM